MAMNSGGDLLFTGMRAGGEPHRTRADPTAQLRKVGGVDGQRKGRSFEIADGADLPGAQQTETCGLVSILGEAQVERTQNRADQPGPQPPAPVRTLRQPAIDKDHRYAAG